ncbi:MAG: 16S rRNA (cytosine(967)-C(5))-methyltransferase RsmB [Candidatus Hydrogenedentota bacterium]
MPVDLVRDAAIDVLLRVFERGWFLDASLNKTLRRKTDLSARGRRFLSQLAYGTVRHRMLCDHVLAHILTQPLDGLPAPIRAILRMGVFQSIFCGQVTHPAMVNTSVDLAKRRGHAGTARLVNAVLRRTPQSLDNVQLPAFAENPVEYLALRYSTPVWLVARWLARYTPEAVTKLCAALDTQAPITLRTNTTRIQPDKLAERLAKAGFDTRSTTPIPEERTLVTHKSPLKSKLFQQGFFILQDPASMLPAHLMEPRDGEKVLDLCAGPGGKSTHLAQLAPGTCVYALELVPHRTGAIVENAERLGLDHVHVCCGDGLAPPVGGGFDAVLVDAPCSGLGTLRRHPDLKYRVDAAAITRLAALQAGLLRSAAKLCKNGGRVVYAVCTFTPEETLGVVEAVQKTTPLEPEDGPEWMQPWRVSIGQYQTRPQDGDLDGFFLMRFRTPC